MRFPLQALPAALALTISLSACGGGSTPGISPHPQATSVSPLKSTNAATLTVPSAGGAEALPATSTIGGSIAFPAAKSGGGTSVTITVSNTPPAGVPTLQAIRGRAATSHRLEVGTATSPIQDIAYISLDAAATIDFSAEPGFTLALPPNIATSGKSFYLALYDPTVPNAGYQAQSLGPAVVTSSNGVASLSFAGQVRPTTFLAGRTYLFALYSTNAPTSTNLYVLDGATQSVYEYPTTARGNVAPSRTLQFVLPATQPNATAAGIAEDAAGNIYLIVANNDNANTGAVYVYDPTASGAATPIRTIAGAATMMTSYASDSYVDGDGNLWVNNGSDFLEFGPGATGNVAPINVLDGFTSAGGIAVAKDGTIYESNSMMAAGGAYVSNLNVFAPGSRGAATPFATFGGTAAAPIGGILALDSANALYTVTGSGMAVSIYPQGSTTPTRTIVGSATGIGIAQPLAVDPISNDLFVGNERPAAGAAPILIFAAGANGNVAPIGTLAGSNVPITNPVEILVGM